MANNSIIDNTQQLYGINGVVISSPVTQVARRAPTVNDRYRTGTTWIDSLNLVAYSLCGFNASGAIWKSTVGGAGTFSSLTVTPGLTDIKALTQVGTASINATGTANTTIGSATGGIVTLQSNNATAGAIVINASNAAGGINVDAGTSGMTLDTTGSLSLDSAAASNFTVTGAADLTLASTNASATAVTINANAAGGGVTANVDVAGKFNVSGGNVKLATAGTGFELSEGPVILAGNVADPSVNGVVAPKGSLYLKIDGAANTTLWVKTGAADTDWTAK